MKLYIERDQAEQKGFFGGSKGFSFSLTCRLELDEAEKVLAFIIEVIYIIELNSTYKKLCF